MTMGNPSLRGRPSMFEFVGGSPAFLALATAFHRRYLEDPVLAHPCSHPGNPTTSNGWPTTGPRCWEARPATRSPSASGSRACLTSILSNHPHRPSRHFDGALLAVLR